MNNTIDEKHYDKNALKGTFYLKGFQGYIDAAADMMSCSTRAASDKINRGVLTHEETIALCRGLGLTPRQYINIFMKDVFDLD